MFRGSFHYNEGARRSRDDRGGGASSAAFKSPQIPPSLSLLNLPVQTNKRRQILPPVSQCLPALLPLGASTLSVIPLSKVWMSIGREVWAFLFRQKKRNSSLCAFEREREFHYFFKLQQEEDGCISIIYSPGQFNGIPSREHTT